MTSRPASPSDKARQWPPRQPLRRCPVDGHGPRPAVPRVPGALSGGGQEPPVAQPAKQGGPCIAPPGQALGLDRPDTGATQISVGPAASDAHATVAPSGDKRGLWITAGPTPRRHASARSTDPIQTSPSVTNVRASSRMSGKRRYGRSATRTTVLGPSYPVADSRPTPGAGDTELQSLTIAGGGVTGSWSARQNEANEIEGLERPTWWAASVTIQ